MKSRAWTKVASSRRHFKHRNQVEVEIRKHSGSVADIRPSRMRLKWLNFEGVATTILPQCTVCTSEHSTVSGLQTPRDMELMEVGHKSEVGPLAAQLAKYSHETRSGRRWFPVRSQHIVKIKFIIPPCENAKTKHQENATKL